MWRLKIPSLSSGEIYTVTGYDDGTTTCTCPSGERRGPRPSGRPSCKHMKSAIRQHELGYPEDVVLPPAYTDRDIKFDRAGWVRHLCYIFSPVDHIKEIVEDVMRVDNEHISRARARDEGEGNFRPSPLPERERAVMEVLLDALSDFDQDSNSPSSEMARVFLGKVLVIRHTPDITNKRRAEAIRNSLCGNDSQWNRLVGEGPSES